MARNYEVQIDINASREVVWTLLTDLPEYHCWNPRTTFVETAELGKKIRMSVSLFGRWFKLPVTVLSLEMCRELRWAGGVPGLMIGSHYFRLEESGRGCRLIQGEDFRGLLAPLLSLPPIEKEVHSLYSDMNAAIKAVCEQ